MIRARHGLALAVCLCAALLIAAAASARTEALRWQQPSQDTVDNYRIYWGTQSGSYSGHLDVGIPSIDSSGTFSYDLPVPTAIEGLEVFFAVTGWNAGLESDFSNEKSRPAPPPAATIGKPGTPQVVPN